MICYFLLNSDLAEFIAESNYRIKSNTEHTDVLNISITDANSIINKPHLVQQIAGSPLSGMPSDIGSNGFVGIRYVHYFDTNNILVELKSMSPPFTTYYNRYSNEQHAWASWYRSIPTVVS